MPHVQKAVFNFYSQHGIESSLPTCTVYIILEVSPELDHEGSPEVHDGRQQSNYR